LAITVAQVDEMSNGRVELGLGAGWYEAEHTAYGVPFPDLGDRFDILEEQLAIVSGLWATPAGQTFDYAGNHYTVNNSPALPKPTQTPGPPIIVGGGGPSKTPRLAAQYASEFNLPFRDIAFFTAQCDRVRAACEKIERDPDSLTYSSALVACIGKDDAEITRRASAIGRDVADLRENGLCGTPEQALERLAQWRDAGAERIYLQALDLDDLDHISLMGEAFNGKL
jgi:alkanesulfonate monooxygenase SsuD/methylene tetrahydromethanopterin reductase-like flavin-dependent oxidoreductase (luciferase family)